MFLILLLIGSILNFVYVRICIYSICLPFLSRRKISQKFFKNPMQHIYSMNITEESCISRAGDSFLLLLCLSRRQFSKTNSEECSILSSTSCSNGTCNHVYTCVYARYILLDAHVRSKEIDSYRACGFDAGLYFDICARNTAIVLSSVH